MNEDTLRAKGFVPDGQGGWRKPRRDPPVPFQTMDDPRINKAGGVSSRTESQRPVCHEPLGEAKGEVSHSTRRVVGIVSFRYGRLLDPDNLCGKYFLDSIRYAGLIEDDSAEQIQFSIRQVQVATPAEERTEILITPIDEKVSKQ
jgi:hypothetical protein